MRTELILKRACFWIPGLSDLAPALRQGLSANTASVQVDIVTCPDLRMLGYAGDLPQTGHYHYDVTPDEVKYIGYFCLAERIYRVNDINEEIEKTRSSQGVARD